VDENRYRVLAIATHPVQYSSPIFRRIAVHPAVDFQVAYCTLRGAESGHDPEFGADIRWDVPLLDGYAWTHIPNRGSGKESFFGLFNPGLWKQIRRGKYDAVLCYVGYVRVSFWIALLASKLSNTAFLFGTDATSLAPRDGRRWKILMKKFLWPKLFRLADQVIPPSGAGVELMRSLSIPEERITLTPFAVDNDWWTAQSALVDREAVRASWGVNQNQSVVLFCAKLQSWKRPLDLLHAFSQADVPETVLVFAGEGPLRRELENRAASLGLGSRVRFLGFVNQSQLPAVYTSADLFVLPSDYDPCPVVVCEAMLCGLPEVISDEVRGRFDLVSRSLTGDIFPCGNIGALADVLRRHLVVPRQLDAMSARARERMQSWSPAQNIAGTLEAVRRAVARVNATRPLNLAKLRE